MFCMLTAWLRAGEGVVVARWLVGEFDESKKTSGFVRKLESLEM